VSLINDALKKAARQRAQETDGMRPMPGGGYSRGPSRGGAKKTQTMILVGGGAVVLVVVSVVLTGIMMNKGAPEAKPVALAVTTPVPTPAAAAPKILVQPAQVAITLPQPAPVIQAPVPTALPTPSPAPIVREEPAAPPAAVQAAPTAAPTAPPAIAAALQPDQIQNLVDNYHISGVRAAGAGSKALIDGHVYKVNDLVDRLLGLRLVKVEEDRLTFTDRTGATYVRTF
jgi:hypothetical protein